MQKHRNLRKTHKKRGGAPKKSSASKSKSNKKRSTFSRFRKLFQSSTYESPPATDVQKIKRAAALPFFNTYKHMAIKEGRLMPSMISPVK